MFLGPRMSARSAAGPALEALWSRTKTKSPQTNGIAERFHKTVLDEFYRIAFRKRLYASIEDLQDDLDLWVKSYNVERPHQGRWCFGKTPRKHSLTPSQLRGKK